METNYKSNEINANENGIASTEEMLKTIRFALASLYNSINDMPISDYKKCLCKCIEDLNIEFENCGIKVLYHYKEDTPDIMKNLKIIQCEPTCQVCDNNKIKSFSVGFEIENCSISELAIEYIYKESNKKIDVNYLCFEKAKLFLSKEIKVFFDMQEIKFKKKKDLKTFDLNRKYKTMNKCQIRFIRTEENFIIMQIKDSKAPQKSLWKKCEEINFIECEVLK